MARRLTPLERVERTAERLRVTRERLEADLERELVAAHEAGHGLRPIARAAGLSVEWTRRLIAKGAA